MTYLQLAAPPRLSSKHVAPALCVTICGLVIAWHCSAMLLPPLISKQQRDVWFDADPPERYESWASRWSPVYKRDTYFHPFYHLLTTPFAWLVTKVTGHTPEHVAQVFLALAAGASTAVMYWLLLAITQSAWISLLWTGIYLASSSFLFWCGILESYCFGMLSMLLPLLIAAYLPSPGVSNRWIVAGLLVSLSITVTNVMSGIAAALATAGLRRTLAALKDCIVAMAVISLIQAQIIPGIDGRSLFSMYLPGVIDEVRGFVDPDERESLWWRPYRVLFAGVMIPNVVVTGAPRYEWWATRCGLSVQTSGYSAMGLAGACVWGMLLLGAAGWGVSRGHSLEPLYVALVMVIAGQLALHTVFGDETFLYSAHYGPVLILFSAYACRTQFGKMAVVLGALLLAIEVANNIPEFLWSVRYALAGGA